MRILYVDIDSLRPDHLGCYGYHRPISPNIDRVAAQGLRFGNCYATDVPCLPSRTAFYQCRHGIHTGVIDHGGIAADPFIQGADRGFRSRLVSESMPMRLRAQGYYTAQISPFGERHAALQFFAGFNEIHNPVGGGGMESAEQVAPAIEQWLERKGRDDDWYLHVNLWDPHTPYRAPDEVIESLSEQPLPAWYTEEVRARHWEGCGPHSAREVSGFEPGHGNPWLERFPHQPREISDMAEARKMFDGYDAGVKWADEHLGKILAKLEELGVLEETAIIITADHGENLGELNIYGDHQTADQITCRLPMIVRWPGVTDGQAGSLREEFIHHFDVAAAAVELVGGTPGADWDARSAAGLLRGDGAAIRDYLVCSQGAWSCQRMVRFDDHVLVRSYHDGYHDFPELMLFDVVADPHEQHDLAAERPDLVGRGLTLLDAWMADMMRSATHGQDPMWTVMQAGGAFHTRGQLGAYCKRLRTTGRAHLADRLAARYPTEL